MPRYSLAKYIRFGLLPTGRCVIRIVCPACGSLHPYILRGGESLCHGCGHRLETAGGDLLASELPENWYDDEGYYRGEHPDNPSFWHDA